MVLLFNLIFIGLVTTFAGSTTSGSIDGVGTKAKFNQPLDIAITRGMLYLADALNNKIRGIISSTGNFISHDL